MGDNLAEALDLGLETLLHGGGVGVGGAGLVDEAGIGGFVCADKGVEGVAHIGIDDARGVEGAYEEDAAGDDGKVLVAFEERVSEFDLGVGDVAGVEPREFLVFAGLAEVFAIEGEIGRASCRERV